MCLKPPQSLFPQMSPIESDTQMNITAPKGDLYIIFRICYPYLKLFRFGRKHIALRGKSVIAFGSTNYRQLRIINAELF